MFRIANYFWVLACKCLAYLFGFVFKFIFRLKTNDCNYRVDHSQDEDQVSSVLETDGFSKKENLDFYFGFKFQNSEAFNTRIGETEDSVFVETSPSQNMSKYQVLSGKDFRGFMEEPETMSFKIQELFVSSNDDPILNNANQEAHLEKVLEFLVGSDDSSTESDETINRVSDDEDLEKFDYETQAVVLAKTEDCVQSSGSESFLENAEQFIFTEHDPDENQVINSADINRFGNSNFSNELRLLLENQNSPLESEPEPNSSSEGVSISNHKEDSVPIDEKKPESFKKIANLHEISISGTRFFDRESVISRDEVEDTDDEYTEFEPILRYSDCSDKKSDTKQEQENLEKEKSEEQKKSWGSDCEEEGGFDILLKHQELIEQMKMEIKNARTKGLPTILEESETLKVVEDLKPLKIDKKLEHKDRVEGIQKVYKSYAEKMRKLDILNYQTTHAISFLHMKDPIQQASAQKTSSFAIKSFLFPNFWKCKLRRIYADPTLKSITELHKDLEMVYVGQLCLSWEILHWQYEKTRELLEHDSEHHHTYNQVAGEFQQFQVLVQRFVENETFQGPRVQNYAKNRFELSTFLQVPVIKDDCLKDKKESGGEGESLVSIAILAEFIDESMRVFWEFLRADKDEASRTNVRLQDPSDSELLIDIKTSLQKKERRLKDIVRTGNCIVKKFQKHQEGRMDWALLFAQVELKLVARVLNTSRLTTDQLVWCQKKLNKISFFNRKIHVEPSFLLFPV
ncbi:zinc finger FYVE domain protein, putative [Actinidia rufa]|uniref:Zinc finger FYVE domain protein, putative n=1 Tax=Actinidia rufa TaxID=165716 RepID=A0A7J0GV48_9ERIC|nr:zinc finger FYVE domain protein, putative [Actinidia rufa]